MSGDGMKAHNGLAVDQASADLLTSRALRKPGRLNALLGLEKERRDVPAHQLVFVGMHNIAQYRWCSEFSLLKSREREHEFFHAYLSDRLAYALELDHVDRLPEDDLGLLKIGDDITFDEINTLLARREPLVREAEAEIRARETPLERGKRLEKAHREPHSTIEWNFEWRGYVFVGVPDGITDKYVYEFKTTQSGILIYSKVVAHQQADLYGFFFDRPKKRVQVLMIDTGEVETWDEKVDEWRAINVTEKFAALDAGGPAELPTAVWKCKRCEFRAVCPVTPARQHSFL